MAKARTQYENLAISSACESVLEIGNTGNLYINERAPWSLLKQGGDAFEAATKVSSRQLYLEYYLWFLEFEKVIKLYIASWPWSLEIHKVPVLVEAVKVNLLQ